MSAEWTIDSSHAGLAFAVKHMGMFTVRGQFTKIGGSVEADEDGQLTAVHAVVDASSVSTGDPKRDGHLRSPDFLDAEHYPRLTFASTAVEPLGFGRYRVTGNMTIRDETRPVTLDVETTNPMTDPYGNRRAGATAAGTLNRKDWGLTWNQVLEFGALLVGEEVRFTIDVEAVLQAPSKAA
jgi:polyisoprenoid-binding protein YceI